MGPWTKTEFSNVVPKWQQIHAGRLKPLMNEYLGDQSVAAKSIIVMT